MYRAVDLSSRRYPNNHFFCRVQAVRRAAPMFCCAQALFRRAKAHMGAWNPSQAKEDFTRVMQLDESLAGTRKFFFYTLFPPIFFIHYLRLLRDYFSLLTSSFSVLQRRSSTVFGIRCYRYWVNWWYGATLLPVPTSTYINQVGSDPSLRLKKFPFL